MNTIRYTIAVLCLGFAFTTLSMAGMPAALGMGAGAPGAGGSTLGDTLNESAGEAPVGGGEVEGQVDGTDDQSIVSVALNSVTFFMSFASAIAAMPTALTALGLPWYFAAPAGSFMVVVASVGILQFISQREWF